MRRTVERLLRGAGLLLLVALVVRLLPRDDAGTAARTVVVRHEGADSSSVSTASLLSALRTYVAGDSADIELRVGAVPDAAGRAALSALTAAGRTVRWQDSSAAAGLAVSVAPLADPDGRVLVSATSVTAAAPLLLRDSAGTIDSVPGTSTATTASRDARARAPATAPRRSSLIVRRLSGSATALVHASHAEGTAAPAAVARRVMLYGRPGWETKFTIAALEEAGWTVDATLRVTARASVTVGTPLALDTARYGAAIVLDSGVTRGAPLERFVRSGGGLVIAGDALLEPSLARLSPARVRGVRAAVPGALLTPSPLQGLDAYALATDGQALAIARDRTSPLVVAVRRGSGRVGAMALRESWRWRMEGAAGGIDAHRDWWSSLVRTVAYVPLAASPRATEDGAPALLPGSAAPYADLVARFGTPSAPRTTDVTRAAAGSGNAILLLLALGALVAEWVLRRMRGVR